MMKTSLSYKVRVSEDQRCSSRSFRRGVLTAIFVTAVVYPPLDSGVAFTNAATAAAQSTGSCPTLVIPGFSTNCAEKVADRGRARWAVDDRTKGQCPLLVKDLEEVPKLRGLQTARPHGEGRITVIVRVVGGAYKDQSQSCKSALSDRTDSFRLDFMSLSNVPWQASGTLTRTAESITLSNITLTPM